MMRWGSSARNLLFAPRRVIALGPRAFSDDASDAAAAAAPADTSEVKSKSQRQKQAKADAAAKAADAKPSPPDMIDTTLASFEQNDRSIQRTAAALSLDPLKVAAYVKLGQIRQQRTQAGASIDVTRSFTPPRSRRSHSPQFQRTSTHPFTCCELHATSLSLHSLQPPLPPCSGYSQMKKMADKIFSFDDTRAAAALSKAAAVARPLFPDRALPPISSVPVSLQPPYANFCVFPYPRVSRFTRAMSQPLSPHILTHGQLPITQRLSG